MGFLTISGGIEINQFALIHLILEGKPVDLSKNTY